MKIFFAIILPLFVATVGWADPPPDSAGGDPVPPSRFLPLPESPLPESPLPKSSSPIDPAVDRIREALQSGQVDHAPGLLGDVLDVIREKGSILDGSVLDPRMELGPDDEPTAQAASKARPTQNVSETVRTAELLLRSARRLESFGGGDAQCVRLIHQMRVRATSMLADLYLSP